MTEGHSQAPAEAAPSLRYGLLAIAPAPTLAAATLVVAALVVGAVPLVRQTWFGGDLLYHSALTLSIVRGEFPPVGAYAGLPAYYPPGFHVMAALPMFAGLSFDTSIRLLTLLWLPVLPIGTFILTRYVTGRRDVAWLAVLLTLVAGGFDFGNDRLWVNSLFMSGHYASPLYPRDVVFAIAPWALYLTLRAFEDASTRPGWRWVPWSLGAAALFAAALLVQVQILLPIPLAIAGTAGLLLWRRSGRRLHVLLATMVIGSLAALPFAIWFVAQLDAIRRNGGIALDSSEFLKPAVIGFWAVPRQLGPVLILALIGVGVVLLFLRRDDGPRPSGLPHPRWFPAFTESGTALVLWAALPIALAVLYQPWWPLEDAVRPQRLWLLAGQPLAILAAIGLVAAFEDLTSRARSPRLVRAAVAVLVLAITVPQSGATVARAATAQTTRQYAHLSIDSDRVPDFGVLLGTRGPRQTVLTYEDWSALAWYETGHAIVGFHPPGYAKLAFDPAIFTGTGQDQRRKDVLAAFRGDLASTTAIADRYDADHVVIAAKDGRWGLADLTMSQVPVAAPGSLEGSWSVLEGNGWDALELEPLSRVTLPLAAASDVDLEIRAQSTRVRGRAVMRLYLVDAEGAEHLVLEALVNHAGSLQGWPTFEVPIPLREGERLVIEAGTSLAIQSVRAYVTPPALPAGWVVAATTPQAVVLGRP